MFSRLGSDWATICADEAAYMRAGGFIIDRTGVSVLDAAGMAVAL